MATEQEEGVQTPSETKDDKQIHPQTSELSVSDTAPEEANQNETENDAVTTDDVFAVNNRKSPERQIDNDVATNTGSTIDTLDSAFHNALDRSKTNTISGSNRADYYEAKSYGKTDAEEELDVLRKKQEE